MKTFQYIYTGIYSEVKPNPIEKDNRGAYIKPGLKVAYNRSGDVVVGTIKSINKNE